MEAVGVGYVFNLFDEGDLPGVDLRETGEYVRVDGSLYPLMKAATYEQSRMVDAALDIRGERRVDDFRWEEPRQIREGGGIDLDAEALDAREASEGMAGRDAHEHEEPTR